MENNFFIKTNLFAKAQKWIMSSHLPLASGCSSGVERQLPKLNVAGSNPVARSILPSQIAF
jgi:hypothetical protein